VKIYRPSTVIIGIVFVLLGGLIRLADPSEVLEDQTRQVKTGTIGASISGDDFTLTVTRVKLAKSVLKHESDDLKDALTTDGVFVAVEFDVAGRGRPETIGNLSLVTSDGATYAPMDSPGVSTVARPAAGFTESQVSIFEANEADLAGLTLRVAPTMVISYYAIDYSIDLGIPSDTVAAHLLQEASAATQQVYVMPKSELRVTS
jgi:hypothetical protein